MLRRVLSENPNCGESHKALAWVLSETNHAAYAVHHVERAEQILGPLPAILSEKSSILRNAVKLPAAIKAANDAIAAASDNPLNWAMLASHLQAEGNLDEMDSVLARARSIFGNHAMLRRMFAIARMERKDWQGAIAELNEGNAADSEALSLFERGRCFERLGEYAKAWADWMRAKELQRAAGCVWNRELAERRFAMLADAARPRRYRDLPKAEIDHAAQQPIFICGLPRSGTTMLEAALAAHPKIAGGDEMMALPDLLQAIPSILNVPARYPLALGALRLQENGMAPDAMRDFYLRKAALKIGTTEKPLALWFTDKMPSNELHWPFMRLIFPAAPIIHTRRHPLDVLISNMAHSLVHGGFISCGLESFAANMVMVDNLQEHYRAKVPDLCVSQVRYESFVAGHEAHIDRMLPAGLAPDPACYDFHLSPWKSRTISHRQIKEPVNDKSIGRYKPFLEFLTPVLGELAPLVERQGYRV